MRHWILILQPDPGKKEHLIDDTFSALRNVQIDTLRRANSGTATLLQFDLSLRAPSAPQRLTALPLVGNSAYTGWLRTAPDGQLFSAIRGDIIPVDASPRSFLGEYSYALLQEQHCVIATDHYATQPVYYYLGAAGTLIATSDIRLLLAVRDVKIEIDQTACACYLSATMMVDENELAEDATFFANIKKLKPHSIFTIHNRDGRCRIEAREDVFDSVVASGGMRNRGDYVHAFRETLNQCVQDRVTATAESLLLSGGLDSSSVLGACLASRSRPPLSIVMSFKDPHLVMSQDDKLLSALFSGSDLPYHMVYADVLRLPTEVDRCAHVDGPDTCANPLIKEAYAAVLQERGLSPLIMTGEGGDAILGEAMHGWIVDALLDSEGMKAVHRYIVANCGFRPGTLAYVRQLLRASFPRLAFRDWRAQMQREQLTEVPPYIHPSLGTLGRRASTTLSRRFHYVGHHCMHSMLFPRASYFDSMNGYCTHSHPFLDPRMMQFAFQVPPHHHFDYFRLDKTNPYAASKVLARDAYVDCLPSFIYGKTHKTSYALMARQIFQNSAADLHRITSQRMELHDRQLIDQETFRQHVLAYIIATEDPNANLGVNYHFIRGVIDLEVWVRRFSGSRARIIDQLQFRPLRLPS